MIPEISMLSTYKSMYMNYGDKEDVIKFYDSMIENSEEIKIVSYKSIPELKELIDEHVKWHKKIPKECYKNSAETTLRIEGIDYVEGILSSYGLPISHGWNVWKGEYYFDLTLELNGRLKEDDTYVKMMIANKKELHRLIVLLKQWGPFSASHYLNKNIILPHGI